MMMILLSVAPVKELIGAHALLGLLIPLWLSHSDQWYKTMARDCWYIVMERCTAAIEKRPRLGRSRRALPRAYRSAESRDKRGGRAGGGSHQV